MNTAAADPLVAKYDVAGPRYTSYPTVPYWESDPSEREWLEHIGAAFASEAPHGAAIYVHIPFCRALCTYCGCNTRITRSHSVVLPYVQSLLAELDLYLRGLGRDHIDIGELHLGGGTPTFLDPGELEVLLSGLLTRARPRADAVCSIEVDPRVTSIDQLALLARYGFRRISIGVQDFDPRVQDIVNRVQSEAEVREVTQAARVLGFDSVNFDLIYGLPLQTAASIEVTMDAVARLRPDRIALYGYAHVPWIRPGQRRFTEADVPQGEEKRQLYELGRERLEAQGYREIGLDHFALETDSLWRAQQSGALHRNFMGYTNAFAQPEKDLQHYQQRVERGELPIHRGHVLDAEDQILRRHILRLMTRLETRWDAPEDYTDYLTIARQRLAEPLADHLIELDAHSCRVTERGRAFLRNICMAFDARLSRRLPDKALFSRTA
jgi:oxygen-independent coproporphyrinogen-3 oxidase